MNDDFLSGLGPAALSQILRRLQEKLTAQNQARFHEMGIPIPPVAVSTLIMLDRKGGLSVSEIAEGLRLSHPRVLKFAAMLENPGLITVKPDPEDGRRKILTLTGAGQELARKLDADRQRLNAVMADLFTEIGVDLASAVKAADGALGRKPLSERMAESRNATGEADPPRREKKAR